MQTDIFIFGGTPSSKTSLYEWIVEAKGLPCKLHLFERPGFGETPPYKRTFAGWKESITEYIAEEGIQRFAVIGISGGGPHALALGEFPTCRKIVLVSSAGRYDSFINSPALSDSSRQLFTAARAKEKDAIIDQLSKRDLSTFHPSVFNYGLEPLADELILIFEDWPFCLESIACEVVSFHGEDDTTTPLVVTEDFAKNIPHYKLRVIPKGNHLFFKEPKHMKEILIEAESSRFETSTSSL
ncbi:MAG: alpha/beta hydrolase [Verrucomicrobiota bacterium]